MKLNESKNFKTLPSSAKKIKEIRQITGLSQVKFSEKYDIKKSTLETWERGTRTPSSNFLNLLELKVKIDYNQK